MKLVATCFAAALALSAAGTWGAPPKEAASKEGFTDAQIVGFITMANQAEIDAGKVAETKALNKDVKAFAQRMVTDHTSANESTTALHIAPEPSPLADKLKQESEKALAHNKTLQGKEFDRAYMQEEVYLHRAVVEELDKRLIPAAQNAQLKALLGKLRPAFQTHLEQAETVGKSAEKSG